MTRSIYRTPRSYLTNSCKIPSPQNTVKFLQISDPDLWVPNFKFIVSWKILLDITQLVNELTAFFPVEFLSLLRVCFYCPWEVFCFVFPLCFAESKD